MQNRQTTCKTDKTTCKTDKQHAKRVYLQNNMQNRQNNMQKHTKVKKPSSLLLASVKDLTQCRKQ